MAEVAAVSPEVAVSVAGSIGEKAWRQFARAGAARLHGNAAPRLAARQLITTLVQHCGGRPSAVQLAMIEQAGWLKLRLTVMDQEFVRTGHRSAHASRDYLAWSNSLVRLVRQLGKRAPEKGPSLSEVLAAPTPDRQPPEAAE